MGKIIQGILGGFSGKVGSVVGCSWKGIHYLRAKAVFTNRTLTSKQIYHCSKFTTAIAALQPITPFLRVGFKDYACGQSAFNAATSYTFNHAILGEYPECMIDYPNLLVARGTLTGANNAVATAVPSKIKFTWENNSGIGEAQPTDTVMVVAINPAKREAAYITEGAQRSAESELLSVSPFWAGDEVHTYLAFISEDDREVATSIYCGSITAV